MTAQVTPEKGCGTTAPADDLDGQVAEGTDVHVRVIPDGPALVRGATVVRDAEGVEHAADRPVVAVCMCGRSRIRPWCDSAHKFGSGR